MKAGECRDCGAAVLWARTVRPAPKPGEPAEGRVPLDYDPRPDGFVVLDAEGFTGPRGRGDRPDLSRRYVPHRLTCPGPPPPA